MAHVYYKRYVILCYAESTSTPRRFTLFSN